MLTDLLYVMDEQGYFNVKSQNIYDSYSLMRYTIDITRQDIVKALQNGIIYKNKENNISLALHNFGWAAGGYIFNCMVCGKDWWRNKNISVMVLGDKHCSLCKEHAIRALEKRVFFLDSVEDIDIEMKKAIDKYQMTSVSMTQVKKYLTDMGYDKNSIEKSIRKSIERDRTLFHE